MASVKSLGMHPPIGADGQPLTGDYTWDVVPDSKGGVGEDELLVTGSQVLWTRGGSLRKTFNFALDKDEPITQALLTYFPTTDFDGTTKKPTLAKALVIFLKTQAHIFFLSGTSHIVHMPFEVESACAAPQGVIIQRKSRTDNVAPISLKFPRVPPNSFVSSHMSPPVQRSFGATSTFSVEGLGRPKPLPMRLSSTMENMFETPLETSDSRWPRLVCLTDPLLELGLVISDQGPSEHKSQRKGSAKAPFLDQAEEILHIETIQENLVLAVTVNRESNMYTVWQLTYIKNEDFFLRHQRKIRNKGTRRRSSIQPGMRSSVATPAPPSFRESLGAVLPGKRNRKSERLEKAQDVEIALALEVDKGGGNTRRQSRRVSSLLARADLSASHERATFAEQSIMGNHGGDRRTSSLGNQRTRQSGGQANFNLSGMLNPNATSLPPVDDVLDELQAGGDFEGFLNMGLDDHDFDGLTREILLTKIHSVPVDNANVRYSLSNKPARTQSKVFILIGPPYATDEEGRRYLLIGIQDPVDQRLQLLTLYIEKPESVDTSVEASRQSLSPHPEAPKVTCGLLRRAQNVVDSCKVFDGDQCTILLLSENMTGQRELSIQAPWSAMSALSLPMLYADNLNSLQYSGTHVRRKVKGRRSVGADFSSTQIEAIRHSRSSGVVDLQDKQGKIHRIQIQLQPASPQVGKVLQVCRSILPSSHGERMLAGWWHIMKWLTEQDQDVADYEWSSVTIQIFVVVLALAHSDMSTIRAPTAQVQKRRSLGPNPSVFKRMQLFSSPNASACPAWMHSRAWQWTMDEPFPASSTAVDEASSGEDFLSSHIRLAKQYMASDQGRMAIGYSGYLPTAFNRSMEDRRRAAWAIISALHLLLEEQKLDIMSPEYFSPGRADLRVILCQIGRWLGWADFVGLHELGIQADFDPQNDGQLNQVELPSPPITGGVYAWIQSRFAGDNSVGFPTLADVYAEVREASSTDAGSDRRWSLVTPRTFMFQKLFSLLKPTSTHVEVVETLYRCGFTVEVMETLPEAILTPLRDAMTRCQSHPPATWSDDLLDLVHRSDVATMLKRKRTLHTSAATIKPSSHVATWDSRMICQSLDRTSYSAFEENLDNSERHAIVLALFKDDRRLQEAQMMLTTNHHRVVRLDSKPQWSEAEYLERQKELVTTVATSTLAIPAGRGLLGFGLLYPLLTQKLSIGGFNLTCVVKPTNNSVSAERSLFTEEKVNWAFFHQGVASGIAISPNAKGIDTSWILYNKPAQDKPGQELSNRHAGFLLALGLNGHLKPVAKWVLLKYLTPKHTMTSIGLLLGLAASYRGTMDSLITKVLSVHVTRLLPRGAAELNLSHHTQASGIMGIGLLYCNSRHRHMSEIMVSEMEYAEDEDEEDPLRNEGYRLAAGFALGFINLGKGTDLKGLHGMRLTEKLLTIASATKKVELVNVYDRSAAGAVVAIALIFMKSEDHIVARKVDVPDSILQFGYVRPDILLLRTLAKNLILWSRIEPTMAWIRASLPREYRWRCNLTGPDKLPDRLRSKDMSFYSILAGLCFSIGFRYAGSANTQVRDILIRYLDTFMRITRLPGTSYDSHLARSNVRMCQDVTALSAAMVMAGTGDLVVLRGLRSLHGRQDADTTYGSHLAAHLAIGALFLGKGTVTFSTSNLAIAALLVAFYPLFPANVHDNRAHLQAFRHFWVLATDPRCLVTKDIATDQPVSVPILIKLRPKSSPSKLKSRSKKKQTADQNKEPAIIRRYTPCLLPPLETVSSVCTDATAQGYWNLELDFERRPELIDDFHKNQRLYLRQRPGHESAFGATVRALGRDAFPEGPSVDAHAFSSLGGSGGAAAAGRATAAGRQRDPLEWVFKLDALADLTHAERAMVLDRNGGCGEGGEEAATTDVDARLAMEAALDGWSREGLEGLRLLFEWADKRSLPTNSGDRKETGPGSGVRPQRHQDAKTDEDGDGWWMRDSVVEKLKGKAWLAAREEEG